MLRKDAIERLSLPDENWDVLVIGGGATGLGIAVDAAARGLRTALIEQADFGQGTSSRSTKLIHGGVRYLRQANIHLVRQSLHERTRLIRNAPHLVHPLDFVVPTFSRWDSLQYGVGLKLYGLLSGSHELGRSRLIDRAGMRATFPTLRQDRLRGGVSYFDAQFDDARFLISLARTAHSLGAAVCNYVAARELIHEGGRVQGVLAEDAETGSTFRIRARSVMNAAGVFADQIRQLDNPAQATLLSPSQGAHVVLDSRFLPGDSALMIPKTDDGRLLFAIPWKGHLLAGTTDTPVSSVPLEPRPFEEEVDFLLEHLDRYLNISPQRSDVRSAFAGLRPLVSPSGSKSTARISRDHYLETSDTGLITMTGGKWTTYRLMAIDAVDAAIRAAGLPHREPQTADLRLIGASETPGESTPEPDAAISREPLYRQELSELEAANPAAREVLHEHTSLRAAHVHHAARYEMARTVQDVLSRRIRLLMLDAETAIQVAPEVARELARELDRGPEWERTQVEDFKTLAATYMVTGA